MFTLLQAMNKRAKKNHHFARTMYVPTSDLIGQRLISTGVFEQTQLDALDAILSNPELLSNSLAGSWEGFVDVGANIGVYTIRYAEYFRKTIAIEANPSTYKVLEANIAASGKGGVHAVCAGASNKKGQSDLRLFEGQAGWASLETTDQPSSSSVRVPTDRLDDLVDEIDPGLRLSMLKIDVEGHEAKVLEGAERHLRRDKPIVLYEKLPHARESCARILRDIGYRNFVTFRRKISMGSFIEGVSVSFEKVDPDQIDKCPLICAF